MVPVFPQKADCHSSWTSVQELEVLACLCRPCTAPSSLPVDSSALLMCPGWVGAWYSSGSAWTLQLSQIQDSVKLPPTFWPCFSTSSFIPCGAGGFMN